MDSNTTTGDIISISIRASRSAPFAKSDRTRPWSSVVADINVPVRPKIAPKITPYCFDDGMIQTVLRKAQATGDWSGFVKVIGWELEKIQACENESLWRIREYAERCQAGVLARDAIQANSPKITTFDGEHEQDVDSLQNPKRQSFSLLQQESQEMLSHTISLAHSTHRNCMALLKLMKLGEKSPQQPLLTAVASPDELSIDASLKRTLRFLERVATQYEAKQEGDGPDVDDNLQITLQILAVIAVVRTLVHGKVAEYTR